MWCSEASVYWDHRQKSKTTSDLSDFSGPIETTLEDIKKALE